MGSINRETHRTGGTGYRKIIMQEIGHERNQLKARRDYELGHGFYPEYLKLLVFRHWSPSQGHSHITILDGPDIPRRDTVPETEASYIPHAEREIICTLDGQIEALSREITGGQT